MRRFAFYFVVGLLAFKIGLFFVLLNLVSKNQALQKSINIERIFNVQIKEPLHLTTTRSQPIYICENKIIKPVWDKIINDKSFQKYIDVRGISESETVNCDDEFETSFLNLNNDQTKELFIKAKWGRFCGMYSGCWLGIFKKDDDKYETVFTNGNTFDFKLGKNSEKKFRDLIIDSNAGNGVLYKNIYQFNGKDYELKKCFWEEPAYFYKNELGVEFGSEKRKLTRIDCQKDDN